MSQTPSISPLQLHPRHNALQTPQPIAGTNGAQKAPCSPKQNEKQGGSLTRVVSQDKLSKNGRLSQQMRVRLRDYLFVASSSLKKNKEMMKQLKKSAANQAEFTESSKVMKKSKYKLPSKEIHRLIKKQVEKQMDNTIRSLREDLQFIKKIELEEVSKQDLTYLHEVRSLLAYKISPALKEIRELSLGRQNLVQPSISLGQTQAQSQQITLTQSKQIKVEQPQQPLPKAQCLQLQHSHSPKISKPPNLEPNKLLESL